VSGFSNPVTNAAGTLVRAVMKSVNYVAGLAGWQISRNGDAEFNSATIRGDVIIGGGTPGSTGWRFTTNIPAELVAKYPQMVAVRLGFTSSGVYWYEGINSSEIMVYGWVIAGTVLETRREFWSGATETTFWVGFDAPAGDVKFNIGPNGGALAGGNEMNIQGVALNIHDGTLMTMIGDLQVNSPGLISVTQDGFIPYGLDEIASNALLNLVVAATNVPGVAIVVNVESVNDVIRCTGVFDFQCVAAPGGTTAIGELTVDGGAPFAKQALYNAGVINGRATVFQQWRATGLAVGNHTFRLTAKATGAGFYQCNALHTDLHVDPRFHK